MAFRFSILFLLLALSFVTSSSATNLGSRWGLSAFSHIVSAPVRTCNGLIGDCIDDDDEMQLDSEMSRRELQQIQKFISYGALSRNRVPCDQRGASYYNCRRSARVNPYRRGCSIITKCTRIFT